MYTENNAGGDAVSAHRDRGSQLLFWGMVSLESSHHRVPLAFLCWCWHWLEVGWESGGLALRGNGCWLTAREEETITSAVSRCGTEARESMHIWLFYLHATGAGGSFYKLACDSIWFKSKRYPYRRSRSLVRITGSKSDLFALGDGLHQGFISWSTFLLWPRL